MQPSTFDQLAAVEDRLWWHESRRDLVRMYLNRIELPDDAAALDVGCGTGGSLGVLGEYASRVTGLEKSAHALGIARHKHRKADLREGDANRLADAFEAESFDLVTLFNVLYHAWITDEQDVLRQIHRVMRPGGILLVSDAAFPCLYRRHDRVILGERRYTLGGMRTLLESAGFKWMSGTYFNAVSFLPAWLLAMRERLRPSRDMEAPLGELHVPPWPINEGMKLAMAVERGFTRLFGRLPFGVTLIALCRKSDNASTADSAFVARDARKSRAVSVPQTGIAARI
jgi:SAM-dependent methyltransferase